MSFRGSNTLADVVVEMQEDDDDKAWRHEQRAHLAVRRYAVWAFGLCSLTLGYVFCIDSCCGGEWLIAWPGVGVLHVPRSITAIQVYSIALPGTASAYLVAWGVTRCAFRRWPWLLAFATSMTLTSAFLRSSIGWAAVASFGLQPVFRTKQSAQQFAERLQRDHRLYNRTHGLRPVLGRVDPILARQAGQWIHEHRQLWTMPLHSRGSPHFQCASAAPAIIARARLRL